MPSTVSSPKTFAQCTQRLEFIVLLSEKLKPGYKPSAIDLVPHSPLSQKSHGRSLNLLRQTAKSGGHIISDLLQVFALHSVSPRKVTIGMLREAQPYCGSE